MVSAPSSTAADVSAPEDEASASEGETSTEEDSTGETSGSADSVEIVEFVFAPEEITVPAGTTVTFTNLDTAPHTATADDSSFDTEELGKSDSAEETFDEPGTFTYYCRFHVFMKGSVVVE